MKPRGHLILDIKLPVSREATGEKQDKVEELARKIGYMLSLVKHEEDEKDALAYIKAMAEKLPRHVGHYPQLTPILDQIQACLAEYSDDSEMTNNG